MRGSLKDRQRELAAPTDAEKMHLLDADAAMNLLNLPDSVLNESPGGRGVAAVVLIASAAATVRQQHGQTLSRQARSGLLEPAPV